MDRPCRGCGATKPIVDFYRSHAKCKHCIRAGVRANRARRMLYYIWSDIVRRCEDDRRVEFPRYGGRNIKLCKRWRTYENFAADIGERPTPGHSIDRKDNNGGYWCGKCVECVLDARPANCHWATKTQQANNRRSSRILVINGESRTVAEWARFTGGNATRIYDRLAKGWPDHEAVYGRAKKSA